MTHKIIDLCEKAIERNLCGKFRKGNVVDLPESGEVIVLGDLHGHRRNFERAVKFAKLHNNPQKHIIFQEILHGGPEDEEGGCLSFELLFDAISYQLRFPDQVHIILGNHDTAVICDNEVMKDGKEMSKAMVRRMRRCFGDNYKAVNVALKNYLLSQPLAVRCANGIWISHSLPADRFIDEFDKGIFERKLEVADLKRPRSVYLLTWGRRHSDEALARLTDLFEANIFILGHQPQETGWSAAGENLIILASDHDHGCLVTFDLAKSYTTKKLIDNIVPLASIA